MLTRSDSKRQTTFNSLASFLCYPSMLSAAGQGGVHLTYSTDMPTRAHHQDPLYHQWAETGTVWSVSGIHLHYNEVEVLISFAACLGGLRGWDVRSVQGNCTLTFPILHFAGKLFREQLSHPAPNTKALQSLRPQGNTTLQAGDERPKHLSVYDQENFTKPSL